MKVGVIGAGTMGQGIAKAFAQTEGFTVACVISSRNGPIKARIRSQLAMQSWLPRASWIRLKLTAVWLPSPLA